VLVGGAGLVAGGLLAACGGGDDNRDTDAGKTTTSGSGGDKSLVAFFDANTTIVAGSEQRMTFGVGDDKGALVKESPAKLDMEVRDTSGKVVGKAQSVARHNSGLPRGYYPLLFTPPAPGSYSVVTELDGKPVTAAFEAITADRMPVPGPGAPMPDVHTPTTADHHGVSPICTREPACPLHSVDLADARTSGKPIALLVATPAYCQVAICGPVLDVLLDGRKPFGDDLVSIHAEVYRSAKQVEADPSNAPLAPALDALHLTFEPCLFLIQPDGRVVKRLDTIFDAVELRQELTALVG
jgi:hypothetical protein